MRTTINLVAFDTLEFVEILKKSGIPQGQAEAITKATSQALNEVLEVKEIATKKDIQRLHTDIIKFINENSWKTIGMIVTFQMIMAGIITIAQHIFIN